MTASSGSVPALTSVFFFLLLSMTLSCRSVDRPLSSLPCITLASLCAAILAVSAPSFLSKHPRLPVFFSRFYKCFFYFLFLINGNFNPSARLVPTNRAFMWGMVPTAVPCLFHFHSFVYHLPQKWRANNCSPFIHRFFLG